MLGFVWCAYAPLVLLLQWVRRCCLVFHAAMTELRDAFGVFEVARGKEELYVTGYHSIRYSRWIGSRLHALNASQQSQTSFHTEPAPSTHSFRAPARRACTKLAAFPGSSWSSSFALPLLFLLDLPPLTLENLLHAIDLVNLARLALAIF